MCKFRVGLSFQRQYFPHSTIKSEYYVNKFRMAVYDTKNLVLYIQSNKLITIH
ncbi:protein of unknown function [Candidatus Nitrosocosmicus franklandus]|uniref:Uncharacterized protein n=1 Tax=Candidatus Nitrosocosmicus franklandianus TaxID=1798806 RepID=A0A484ICY4_9ARCH|nr:protein of unknown function [Candidatus Nitrosocosmicus franklandus]